MRVVRLRSAVAHDLSLPPHGRRVCDRTCAVQPRCAAFGPRTCTRGATHAPHGPRSELPLIRRTREGLRHGALYGGPRVAAYLLLDLCVCGAICGLRTHRILPSGCACLNMPLRSAVARSVWFCVSAAFRSLATQAQRPRQYPAAAISSRPAPGTSSSSAAGRPQDVGRRIKKLLKSYVLFAHVEE